MTQISFHVEMQGEFDENFLRCGNVLIVFYKVRVKSVYNVLSNDTKNSIILIIKYYYYMVIIILIK